MAKRQDFDYLAARRICIPAVCGGGSLCAQSPRALLEFGRRKSARVPQTCRERLWLDCDASAVLLYKGVTDPLLRATIFQSQRVS